MVFVILEHVKEFQTQTIYFDGECRFCRVLIGKVKESKNSRNFILKDISNNELPESVSDKAAQKEIYVKNDRGKLLRNIDGIISIIRVYGLVGKIIAWTLSLPGIYFLEKIMYRIIAKFRKGIFK